MSDVQKSKRQLQKDLSRLVDDTEALLGSTADVADKSVKTARTKVEESLRTVQEQIESGTNTVEEKVEEGLRTTDQTVRANPYASIGISLGVGLLLGFIFGRK